MMALTHAAISLSGACLFLGDSSPLVIGLALLGSQLPDIDTTTSISGRMAYPVARWIEERYPHRTVTHSLLVTMGLLAAGLPLAYWFGLKAWLALPLGHLLSCFSDTCTKEGVALFWPSPVRAIYGGNPRNRLRTGSTAEYWVLAFFLGVLVLVLNLQSSGGIIVQFNQLLGIRDGVEQVYNRSGGSHQVYVQVQGVREGDRRPVKGRFFLVGQSGQEFVLQDEQGLYLTGSQILVKRMTASVGQPSTTQHQTLSFNDDDLMLVLEELQVFHPSAAIYLSGTIQVDEPEGVMVEAVPGELASLQVSGGTVLLNCHPLEQAIMQLGDQYAIGQLTAKIVYPAPEL